MSERWAILVLFTAAIAGWSVVLRIADPGPWALIGLGLTTAAMLAWWAGADAKARGAQGLQYVEGLLLLLFAPAGLGMYLVRSRGVAVGLATLLGFVALYVAATIGGELIATM